MMSIKMFVSERRAANLLQRVRWRDGVSKDRLTQYLRAFQLRRDVFRKPGEEVLKTILETAL